VGGGGGGVGEKKRGGGGGGGREGACINNRAISGDPEKGSTITAKTAWPCFGHKGPRREKEHFQE